jgi:hypothetical protein
MKQETILDKFKNWVAGIGWALFLWGSQMTQEEYWQRIARQERERTL